MNLPKPHHEANTPRWRNREPRPCLGSTNLYYKNISCRGIRVM